MNDLLVGLFVGIAAGLAIGWWLGARDMAANALRAISATHFEKEMPRGK